MTDLLLFGRMTYEGMAKYWTTAKGEVADLMNAIPKMVFSTTLKKAEWNNTRLINENAVDEVANLGQKFGLSPNEFRQTKCAAATQ